nr:hypothetical protein [Polymorphobacter sp.]
MFAIDVRVAQNHRHGFVAADLHDGRNVGFGAHESGDGGVPHDVRGDDIGIHAGGAYNPPKAVPEVEAMAGPGVRIPSREYPAFRVSRLATFMEQCGCQIGGDRLLAAAPLCDRHENAPPVEIDHRPFDADDLGMAHTGA